MIVLGRHRALTPDAWSELAVRAAIEEIVADAIAQFHPDTFWPGHPSDDGVGDGNTSFYVGAAGVIWALDYLHRIGATRAVEDFRPVLPKLLERTIAAFASNSPTDYAKHGSLLFGDMGAALVAMRLPPHMDPIWRDRALPIRHDGHRPISRRSDSRRPRAVYALDRRRRPCNLPLGLHHRGASFPDDR